jgi:hypothetical protein
VTDSERQESEVPVLTQIVVDEPPARSPAVDAAALEALARQLERVVLERLGAEIDRVVREAVAAALAEALAVTKRG